MSNMTFAEYAAQPKFATFSAEEIEHCWEEHKCSHYDEREPECNGATETFCLGY